MYECRLSELSFREQEIFYAEKNQLNKGNLKYSRMQPI